MSLIPRFRTVARAEAACAHAWYEERREGLGQEFMRDLETTLNAVCDQADRGQPVFGDFRRAKLERFPYAVYYVVQGEVLHVAAIHHLQRDPKRLKQRLDSFND